MTLAGPATAAYHSISGRSIGQSTILRGEWMTSLARLSVDIGGTFTDLVLLRDDGMNFSCKVSSTPDKPEDAVITGVNQILQLSGAGAAHIVEVFHGTTVGSNTLLQKTGARCGLITTRGFRDILEIGRLRTPSMFDLGWDKPEPLIQRRYRLEADERTAADGSILRPLDLTAIEHAGRFFTAEGIESVAICFINSYRNPANEREAARYFTQEFPGIPVTASVDVLPESGEYERTSTAAVNAYVLPAMRGYFRRLEDKLKARGIRAPLFIGNSNGGLSAAAVAREKPVFFISSGRASGAAGAARLGAATGEPDLVVFDMGGTTASAALIHRGVLSRANEYEFRAGMSVPSRFIKAGGYMMRVPTVDVAEVGNGAGSIAAIDAAGLITVGPVSAGARPGPVCYGLGGERPTVTDANVVLGYLPTRLAGGSLTLDTAKAAAAIERVIGRPLGFGVEAAAFGIREIANSNMVCAIRAVTVERGLDPRDLTLFAFGGSGPVHACDVARTLGISRVLFPPGPGVFTATGMLAGAVEHHELRSCQSTLSDLDPSTVASLKSDMTESAAAALAAQGYAAPDILFSFEVDLRLEGQEASHPVQLAETLDRNALRAEFSTIYRELYGYIPTDTIETVSLRLQAVGRPSQSLDFMKMQAAAEEMKSAPPRNVYFDGVWLRTPVITRDSISGRVLGPVIIESADTTIVIPPGASVSANATGSLIATLPRGAP